MHGVSRRTVLAAALLVLGPRCVLAQSDTAFARQVRTFTTDPRFLPASVATLPLSASIPSPMSLKMRP